MSAWYRIALADVEGIRLVVAPGEHLGEAIEIAQARARRGHDTWPVAAEVAEAGEVPLGDSVGKGVMVERGAAPPGLPRFRWPSGVLPTLDGALHLQDVRDGHRRTRNGDVLATEAVVSGDRLVEVFMQVVELLPTADNVEVRVAGHHDAGGTTEVWLSPRMADVRKAIRFLDDHDVELLGNGHVEVAIYLRQQNSTLRLTEHKTLVWLTENPELADAFAGWMTERGVPARDPLALLSTVDHSHWRPTATRSRKKLLAHLERMRLRRVDSWQAAV